MSATMQQFRDAAAEAIGDAHIQHALDVATTRFRDGRQAIFEAIPDSEGLRDQLKAIRSATLSNLAAYLRQFEQQAQAAGAQVHWARDGQEAAQIVLDIAKRRAVTMAVKSKSMVSEEIHLNQALEASGIEAVETDLGEWIIQLAGDGPSHIIAPAIHKTRYQVADLLSEQSGKTLSPDDIPVMTAEARRILRDKFLAAGMGLSGANMGIAETGSVVLVTNEGNGRMVTSVPPVHVALMGIEKLVPTWRDAAVWLSLLAPSATGQRFSVYSTVLTGPRREPDVDGPEEVHIVLLDNGRAAQIGTAYEEVLQCIRCGACLNACPVYREAGGHAYQSPYSGPIGAVITPLLFGREEYKALPHASSLCGACLEVCPVRIDLPRMLLELRKDQAEQQMGTAMERMLEQAFSFGMARPALYAFGGRVARLLMRPFARGSFLKLPGWLDVTKGRRVPVPAKRTFHDLWKDGEV